MEFRLDDNDASGIANYDNNNTDISFVGNRIILPDGLNAKSIKIYSVNGQLVYSLSDIAGQTGIINLKHGLYIVKCIMSNGRIVSKKIST